MTPTHALVDHRTSTANHRCRLLKEFTIPKRCAHAPEREREPCISRHGYRFRCVYSKVSIATSRTIDTCAGCIIIMMMQDRVTHTSLIFFDLSLSNLSSVHRRAREQDKGDARKTNKSFITMHRADVRVEQRCTSDSYPNVFLLEDRQDVNECMLRKLIEH